MTKPYIPVTYLVKNPDRPNRKQRRHSTKTGRCDSGKRRKWIVE